MGGTGREWGVLWGSWEKAASEAQLEAAITNTAVYNIIVHVSQNTYM